VAFRTWAVGFRLALVFQNIVQTAKASTLAIRHGGCLEITKEAYTHTETINMGMIMTGGSARN